MHIRASVFPNSFVFTYLILFLSLLNTPNGLFSQNLFPNGQFENYSLCPSGYNQTVYLTDWISANATPDYYNCTYYGSAVQGMPASGSGLIGLWGGSNHPSCGGMGYAESLIGNLSSPIQTGESYTVTFELQIDGLGNASAAPNGCMDFGFYFFTASNPPPTGLTCCPMVSPQVSVSGASLQMGTYTLFSFSFTATDNFEQVMIGSFCNSLSPLPSCANYANNRMYFNLDNVSLERASVLPIPTISGQKSGNTSTLIQPLVPNPISGTSVLEVSLKKGGHVQLEIIDLSGRIIRQASYTYSSGNHSIPVSQSGISRGMYLLKTRIDQPGSAPHIKIEKISVQH